MATFVEQTPTELLPLQEDWSDWLAGFGNDTIATSVWTCDAGITLSNQSKTDTTTTAWVTGGTVGQVYAAKCAVVTATGMKAERTMSVTIIASR